MNDSVDKIHKITTQNFNVGRAKVGTRGIFIFHSFESGDINMHTVKDTNNSTQSISNQVSFTSLVLKDKSVFIYELNPHNVPTMKMPLRF